MQPDRPLAATGLSKWCAARRVLPTLALCLTTSCAGYRGGWHSVPYIGTTPPAALQSGVTERASAPELSR